MSLRFWNRLLLVCVWLSNTWWTLAVMVAVIAAGIAQPETALWITPLGAGLIWLLWSTELHKPSFWAPL